MMIFAYIIAILHIYYIARSILYFWLWASDQEPENNKKASLDENLPVYTILCPMFKEERVVEQLINNLSNMSYDKKKMQIIILLEDNDIKVIDTVSKALPYYSDLWIDVVICPAPPKGQNRTKPRALNFALPHIAGDYVVIYDAEDEPEVDQLRKAVYMFQTTKHACIQACLNYRNFEENWLARMFSTEYSVWFDGFIPGLTSKNMAVPLGGTSNHFRAEIIRKVGGWDAYNVTEDCELGLRLYSEGYTVGWLQSTTWEEACCKPWPWIKQRTRWIKGYMYTYVNTAWKPQTTKGLISWHLFVLGTPLVTLINPLLIAIMVYGLFGGNLHPVFPHKWMHILALICLFGGNSIYIATAAGAAYLRNRNVNALLAITFPIYWLMMSVAAYRALWQMIVAPSVWEKTEHGVSSKDNRGGK